MHGQVTTLRNSAQKFAVELSTLGETSSNLIIHMTVIIHMNDRVQAELKKEVQRKYQGKVVAPPGNELIQKKTIFNNQMLILLVENHQPKLIYSLYF